METHVIERISSPMVSTPKLQSSYPHARIHGRVISTRIVGVSFNDRQEIVAKLQIGDRIWLEREPDNPHDPNAIMVARSNGDQIGYINRYLAASLAPYFDAYGYPMRGKVRLLTGSSEDGYQLGVIIAFKMPKAKHTNQGMKFEDLEGA